MLYFYVSVAYTATNLLLGTTVLLKARGNLVHRFYFFCVLCLTIFGVSGYALTQPEFHLRGTMLEDVTIFLFSLIPFFFLHFIVIFLRRYDILRSRLIFFTIYFAGLFSYAMVLRGYIPTPLSGEGVIASNGYIYYITWASVFFSIGIALLFSFLEGFSERGSKSNLLMTGFALLMLVLPSPFTESIYYLIFRRNVEIYGLTSAFSLLIAIYLIFRHKIIITLYDAVRTSLVVMNDIFILTTPKFRIEMVRGAVGLMGYDESEMLGRFLNDFIVEKYYIDNYLQYVEQGKMKECLFDAEVLRKDGAHLIMDFSFSPVFENETIAGFVGIGRDVTKRKSMELALRASEERFRRLAENAPDIIYHYRLLPHHGFEYVSSAAVEITHYSPEEFYARPELFLEIVHPEDRAEMEKYFQGEGLFGQTFAVRLLTKDGRMIWTEQRNVPVYDDQGYRVAIEGIIRDVTERKELEDQLRQAQKFESIGILAGGIAHDFNNILAIVLGSASRLRLDLPDRDKLDHHVSMIEGAVERGAGIVRELLTIARKSDAKLEPTNINHVVEELVKLLGETFPRTIDLSLNLLREAPLVVADANQIHQALFNLCVNARDAMPTGGILSLYSEIVPREALEGRIIDLTADRYLKLCVADTGKGIPEEVRARMFEPFFTTKPVGKGTGLGLAVVYGIVKSHGGSITAESEVNVGTVFSIYLPLQEIGASSQEGQFLRRGSDAIEGAETILLVEDEEMLLILVKSILQERGYSVLVARDGQEALEVFEKNAGEINLLLTDMGLPKIGGWDLYQEILKKYPGKRAVFASGFFEPSLYSEMTAAGAKHFIQKPYNPTEILAKVRMALDSVEA